MCDDFRQPLGCIMRGAKKPSLLELPGTLHGRKHTYKMDLSQHTSVIELPKQRIVDTVPDPVTKNEKDTPKKDTPKAHELPFSFPKFIDTDSEVYFKSRTQSFALASTILQRLPRELRDLIYEFYLDANPIDWYRVLYNSYWNTTFSRAWTYLPHFVLQEYSGLQTAREVGEAAYRIAELNLYEQVGVLQLSHILSYDHLGRGILPSDFLRRIEMTIDPYDLEDRNSIRGEKLGAKLYRMPVNINALLNIRPKAKFSLKVRFERRLSAVDVVEIMKMFLPVYIELSRHGASFQVTYRREVKGLSERPIMDLTAMLDMRKEEWRGVILGMCSSFGPLTGQEIGWAEEERIEDGEERE